MTFDLDRCLEVLERMPATLDRLLGGLSLEWTAANEGPNTWSPFDVVGHLIHGERTDWMARMDVILGDGPDKTFVPFDRFAQLRESEGKRMPELLAEFAAVRASNVSRFRALKLT